MQGFYCKHCVRFSLRETSACFKNWNLTFSILYSGNSGNIAGGMGASFSPHFSNSSLKLISQVNFESPFLNKAFLAFVL